MAIPVLSPKVATGAHEMRGHVGTAATQRWAESLQGPPAPAEAQSADKGCVSINERD